LTGARNGTAFSRIVQLHGHASLGPAKIRCDALAQIAHPRQKIFEEARQTAGGDGLHAAECSMAWIRRRGAPFPLNARSPPTSVLIDSLQQRRRTRHVIAHDQELRDFVARTTSR
jgi:hypothetical protein